MEPGVPRVSEYGSSLPDRQPDGPESIVQLLVLNVRMSPLQADIEMQTSIPMVVRGGSELRLKLAHCLDGHLGGPLESLQEDLVYRDAERRS